MYGIYLKVGNGKWIFYSSKYELKEAEELVSFYLNYNCFSCKVNFLIKAPNEKWKLNWMKDNGGFQS